MSVYSPMHPQIPCRTVRSLLFRLPIQYGKHEAVENEHEPLYGNVRSFSDHHIPIPDDRMTDGRKMCTDLVGSAGNKMDFKFRISIRNCHRAVFRFNWQIICFFLRADMGNNFHLIVLFIFGQVAFQMRFFRAALLLQYNGNISGQYVFLTLPPLSEVPLTFFPAIKKPGCVPV